MSRRQQQQFRSETVTIGHDCIGAIYLTDRGFECFDAQRNYLFTEVTLQGNSRRHYERHRDREEVAA
ncbi:hypothetical protein [Devosia sp. RR2S18]|uniref:hypothetical protein n=1 Tax=Devosia rhizosphaerae TaxID=3049774 RepID=UPI00253FC759|nr:hypothetical protein [Devosia sp. RR2S18]WIJ26615.1 hypothetical protein QOV41_07645 [Devosia sp. RR2S18]